MNNLMAKLHHLQFEHVLEVAMNAAPQFMTIPNKRFMYTKS